MNIDNVSFISFQSENVNPNGLGKDIKFPPIITLNVGGRLYMTRLSTLRKYPESMLAAMFSGRHKMDKDKDGHYFLDTNGDLFGQILDYLRHGTVPPNAIAIAVYQEANYYGLHTLMEELQLKPAIASLAVKEAHRAQFPSYYTAKDEVIRKAMDNAALNKVGEVTIYAFRTEFTPRASNFNPNHGCVIDSADVQIGPWKSSADEETFMRCLEADLLEDGFHVRQRENTKRKCKYYFGQTCPRFVFKLQIIFNYM